jgi:hypothetical protein
MQSSVTLKARRNRTPMRLFPRAFEEHLLSCLRRTIPEALIAFEHHVFTTGSRYGFIGERKHSGSIQEKSLNGRMRRGASLGCRNYPQSAYTAEVSAAGMAVVQSLRILVMLSPTLRKQFPNHSFQLFGMILTRTTPSSSRSPREACRYGATRPYCICEVQL